MEKISDIMHSIISIDKNELISTAAKKMSQHDRGSILVTDKTVPVGMFTERDILRLVAMGIKIQGTRLEKYYSRHLFTIDQDTPIDEASKMMRLNGVRRLLVTKEGSIIGIITSNDISKNMRYSIAEKLLSNSVSSNIGVIGSNRYF